MAYMHITKKLTQLIRPYYFNLDFVYDVILLHSKPAKVLVKMNMNKFLKSVPCLEIQEDWKILCDHPSGKVSGLIGWHL